MAERFENSDNILRDSAEISAKKSAVALNRFEKQEQKKIKPFLLKNDPKKVLEQSQSAVERD